MPPVVGLVVVSHSRALARAAVALAQQMLPSKGQPSEGQPSEGQPSRGVRIEVAAGLDDTTLGTDAGQIAAAITAADQGGGVVVLMDLGSAVLSAELALDLLDDDTGRQVLLSPAPLVEGLLVAAVAAAGGATREEVAAEAAGALAGKTAHLSSPGPVLDGELLDGELLEGDQPYLGELVGTFTVANPHGLHARPAARLVQLVRALDAPVRLRNLTTDSPWVRASSLSRVSTLGAVGGHEVEVRIAGPQQALDQLLALAARGFGDDLGTEAPGGQGERRTPLPASPGIGIGPACSTRFAPLDIPAHTDDPAGQWHRLQAAIATVRGDVQRVQTHTAREVGAAQAAIFDAHLLLLDDADLLDEVRSRVHGRQAAAAAWSATLNRVGAELAALPDQYQQARAADVHAVGDQVLRALLGVPDAIACHGGVLVAADLTPAQAAQLDPRQVCAVLLAFGAPMSHSAIMLRARGIPAIAAAGPAVLNIDEGTLLAVDGTLGEFVIDPPPDVVATWRTRAADLARRDRHALAHAASPAATSDGVAVLVGANIGSFEDAKAALACGADLAGLVRTEFLFLGRAQAPDVEEQEAAYRSIAQGLGGRRITLRTLDVGADKPLRYLPTPAEANPFLGVRGIRLSLAHPAQFCDQLLAMVRVAHDVPVSLMFPMISTFDEFRRARRMLDDAIAVAGRGRPPDLQVGIMVEVPATALKAATFAPHVDFLSIGTNDLTQYALAAERGNPAVACDPCDPGVLRLVDVVCQGAGRQARVAVCGELAADERACALLLGLGVRELSVAPPAVPAIKQMVRGVHSRDAAALARAALAAQSATSVRELLAERVLDQQA
ncbi:MAG: phosphoenolpyruvate--protein phosphotransferase [Pseudonocardiales bacterium]